MFISGDAGARAAGLRVLALFMGTFLIFMGIDKVSWLTDSSVLTGRLGEWLRVASPTSRWYLEAVAIPGAPVFARLVVLGELITGTSLVIGFKVRLAAAIALLMVSNFHFASGVVFNYSYLTNGYGLPVIGSLLALAVSGRRLPLSLSK